MSRRQSTPRPREYAGGEKNNEAWFSALVKTVTCTRDQDSAEQTAEVRDSSVIAGAPRARLNVCLSTASVIFPDLHEISNWVAERGGKNHWFQRGKTKKQQQKLVHLFIIVC